MAAADAAHWWRLTTFLLLSMLTTHKDVKHLIAEKSAVKKITNYYYYIIKCYYHLKYANYFVFYVLKCRLIYPCEEKLNFQHHYIITVYSVT